MLSSPFLSLILPLASVCVLSPRRENPPKCFTFQARFQIGRESSVVLRPLGGPPAPRARQTLESQGPGGAPPRRSPNPPRAVPQNPKRKNERPPPQNL